MVTDGGMLSTVTVTGLDEYWTPSRSRATAVNVWVPALTVVVFHGTE
jgi:hypothetical protein